MNIISNIKYWFWDFKTMLDIKYGFTPRRVGVKYFIMDMEDNVSELGCVILINTKYSLDIHFIDSYDKHHRFRFLESSSINITQKSGYIKYFYTLSKLLSYHHYDLYEINQAEYVRLQQIIKTYP